MAFSGCFTVSLVNKADRKSARYYVDVISAVQTSDDYVDQMIAVRLLSIAPLLRSVADVSTFSLSTIDVHEREIRSSCFMRLYFRREHTNLKTNYPRNLLRALFQSSLGLSESSFPSDNKSINVGKSALWSSWNLFLGDTTVGATVAGRGRASGYNLIDVHACSQAAAAKYRLRSTRKLITSTVTMQ